MLPRQPSPGSTDIIRKDITERDVVDIHSILRPVNAAIRLQMTTDRVGYGTLKNFATRIQGSKGLVSWLFTCIRANRFRMGENYI